MEIRIIPYRVEHYFALDTEYTKILHELYGYSDPMKVAQLYLRGPAYSLFVDGEIVVIAGIIKLWPGVGDAFMIPTPKIKKHKLLVTRTIRKFLRDMINKKLFVRLQAIVDVDFTVGQDWIEALGFHVEGKMRKFFGGKDFFRYSIVAED